MCGVSSANAPAADAWFDTFYGLALAYFDTSALTQK
jgi:hypothetical protein